MPVYRTIKDVVVGALAAGHDATRQLDAALEIAFPIGSEQHYRCGSGFARGKVHSVGLGCINLVNSKTGRHTNLGIHRMAGYENASADARSKVRRED